MKAVCTGLWNKVANANMLQLYQPGSLTAAPNASLSSPLTLRLLSAASHPVFLIWEKSLRFDRLVRYLLLNLSSEHWVLLGSILNLGEVAEIRSVTRFPAEDHVGGNSKIPTIIHYDKHGGLRAVGAEAKREGIEADAEDEEWTKAEWQVLYILPKDCAHFFTPVLWSFRFKLHLCPQSSSAALIASHAIPPLPKGKTVIDVFADFLRYPNGADMWQNLETRTDFVLTHPNSWEGTQQS
ncbi:hypothetical protein CVT25_010255 [Psilocybe cyanescens]|uniref:Uncharacterized protein n=1 Tax=Psilocybe cyanescens TaxID=93625 RepID=A0A409X2S2_PSICY|nr:hypothetical protein CVT25_010255 [Psilocybe cyanescens]